MNCAILEQKKKPTPSAQGMSFSFYSVLSFFLALRAFTAAAAIL